MHHAKCAKLNASLTLLASELSRFIVHTTGSLETGQALIFAAEHHHTLDTTPQFGNKRYLWARTVYSFMVMLIDVCTCLLLFFNPRSFCYFCVLRFAKKGGCNSSNSLRYGIAALLPSCFQRWICLTAQKGGLNFFHGAGIANSCHGAIKCCWNTLTCCSRCYITVLEHFSLLVLCPGGILAEAETCVFTTWATHGSATISCCGLRLSIIGQYYTIVCSYSPSGPSRTPVPLRLP